MLTSARAKRGPQWDVATQQCARFPRLSAQHRFLTNLHATRFLVEKDSELYYDATVLLDVTRELHEKERPKQEAPLVGNSANTVAIAGPSTIMMSSNSQRGSQLPPQPQQMPQRIIRQPEINTPIHVQTPVQFRPPYAGQGSHAAMAFGPNIGSPMVALGTPMGMQGGKGTPRGYMQPETPFANQVAAQQLPFYGADMGTLRACRHC